MSKPVVGISIWNLNDSAGVFGLVRDLGMRPILFDPNDEKRWDTLISSVGREAVVCVIDDQQTGVIAATALGVHAVAYQPSYSWHLVMNGVGHLSREALSYRLKEWRDKNSATPN
jgi:hypothetical protein